MSSEVTYQAFRCKDCIFVMHLTGNTMPQELTAFRKSRQMFAHNGRLVGLYDQSETHSHNDDMFPGHMDCLGGTG